MTEKVIPSNIPPSSSEAIPKDQVLAKRKNELAHLNEINLELFKNILKHNDSIFMAKIDKGLTWRIEVRKTIRYKLSNYGLSF